MPIENFQIEQEQENLPVNLFARNTKNDFINNHAKVGDVLWVSIIRDGYNKSGRLDSYVKPVMVTVTHVYTNEQNPRITFDFGKAKLGHNAQYYISNSFEALVSTTKEGCAFLHDEKIISIARNRPFSQKQSLYKRLISRPAPQDDALVEALNWQDTLTEVEKGHIKKLIEMSK